MNRRSFLSFLGLAPLVAVPAAAQQPEAGQLTSINVRGADIATAQRWGSEIESTMSPLQVRRIARHEVEAMRARSTRA